MTDVRLLNVMKKSRVFTRVRKDMEASSTFLFVSPDGECVQALLLLTECALYCSEICLQCNECRKVLAGNKVDVVNVNPGGETIPVEQMRQTVVEDSYVSAVEGGKKAYVIRNLPALNASNQNVLLKTLEEPPEKVNLLLTAPTTEGILPTILSRVNKYVIPPMPTEEATALLTALGVANAAELAGYAGGNIEEALRLAGDDTYLDKARALADVYANVCRSTDVPAYLNAPAFENIDDALDISEKIWKDVLYLYAEAEGGASLPSLADVYQSILSQVDKNAIAAIMRELHTARCKATANCNKTNIIDSLLLKVAEEKAKCKK